MGAAIPHDLALKVLNLTNDYQISAFQEYLQSSAESLPALKSRTLNRPSMISHGWLPLSMPPKLEKDGAKRLTEQRLNSHAKRGFFML